MTERVEAIVRGDVQGVGFRWFVRRHAAGLGLVGWVANESDGSVRVVVEGRPDAVERLVGLLHDGPSGALVESVDVARLPAQGDHSRFEIRARGHRGD
jgi:acylphosphatase